MSANDSYASRVKSLRRDQSYVIVSWVTSRVIEQMSLDAAILNARTEYYIDWSGTVVDAALANLGKRRWSRTEQALTRSVSQSLEEAKRRQTDGVKGMPLLLKSAFFHNVLIDFLGREQARLVAVDLEAQRGEGLTVIGETRSQALRLEALAAGRTMLPALLSDIKNAGEASRAIAPEPLATPQGGASGPQPQRLAGHWVYSDPYRTGNSSFDVELHMVLLADGCLLRTKRSVAFSSLRDSGGNWNGSLDVLSGLTNAERGHWETSFNILTLEMDDGSAYEFRYELSGAVLTTTNTSDYARRTWRRAP